MHRKIAHSYRTCLARDVIQKTHVVFCKLKELKDKIQIHTNKPEPSLHHFGLPGKEIVLGPSPAGIKNKYT